MLIDHHRLTLEEVQRFHYEGYLGPFTLCLFEEMAVIRKRIEDEILTNEPPIKLGNFLARHLIDKEGRI